MPLAPIVIFAYNRPFHLRRTVEALQKNELAVDSALFIYSDAAKNVSAIEKVAEVRKYINSIDGFKKISIFERQVNLGLANSIIDGVTQIVNEYGKIIVLEDDMLTSPYFLRFMNEALDLFSEDERVISAHGWCFPTNEKLPEAFFQRGADCWGWATWRRGWGLFNSNGQELLDEIGRRGLRSAFDLNGAYPFCKMLERQIIGENDSWAIRWHASAFLAEKLTLYPGRSLVHNIGNDSSGAHCGRTNMLDVNMSCCPINLHNVEVAPSIIGSKAKEKFFRQLQRKLSGNFMQRVAKIISKVTT